MNLLSLDGAEALRNQILRFWQGRGYVIEIWVERVPGGASGSVCAVRSNMINGLPKGWRDDHTGP